MGENIFDGRATIDGNGTRKAQGKSGMLFPETYTFIKLDFGNGAKSPQQISGLFDFLPWVWARCPGCRGELVVQVVLLQEMRWECSCSLLSDRITHQLHVSLMFMQHVNYRCDPYKLYPEQPIDR